jgi:putative glutamine amidotransferase
MPLTQAPLLIGVTARHGHDEWIEKNTHNYINRLLEYGAVPVVLSPDVPVVLPNGLTFTPDQAGSLPTAILDYLHGVIFAGGGDVDPVRFGQPLNGADAESIDPKRDELEIQLGQAALRLDMPIFGICRGCQVLNVAAGGGMVQHLDDHRSAPEQTRFHPVALTEGTRLHAIVGAATLSVNTFHHQGLDHATLAPIFTPSATAQPDPWLIEAYESPHHRWVVGVQWHPERTFELEEGHRKLWDNFIQACRVRTPAQHAPESPRRHPAHSSAC